MLNGIEIMLETSKRCNYKVSFNDKEYYAWGKGYDDESVDVNLFDDRVTKLPNEEVVMVLEYLRANHSGRYFDKVFNGI